MKRRRFLIGAGATTSAAVAGCLGEDDGNETEEGGGDDALPTDDADGGDDDGGDNDDSVSDDGNDDGGDGGDNDDSVSDDGNDDGGDGGDNDDSVSDDGNDDGGDGDGNDDDGADDDENTGNENGEGDDSGSDDGTEELEDDAGDDSDGTEGSDDATDDDGGEGGDDEGDPDEGDEPETHTLAVEIDAEPGYNRPSETTVAVADERVETEDALVSLELEAGTHSLEVAADGFETAERTVSLDDDTTVTVELQRRYEDIRIADHEVTVTRREESDDTVEATIVLENRSDFESTRVWVEAWATDQDGDSFGHAESQAISVPAEEDTRVELTLARSITDAFEEGRRVDDYEVTVATTGTFRVLDSATG
ncbi:PEGA domain-containing protein [Natrononativus amylolyticus]|uniref:PEGA domain-containing protein n=1 Tax=Natrononativus amylolyticus TaxID=2963434 RepID=UPI0020CD5BB3|nr:PEGA domain-containing protein [Natrononativus amylolyticus]